MTYPTIYVSISDGERHLAIDGHIDLLKRFVSIFVFGDSFQWIGIQDEGKPKVSQTEYGSEAVKDGKG